MPTSTFHAVVPLKSPQGTPEPSFHWGHNYCSIDANVSALWRRKSHLRSILMMLIGEALVLENSRDMLSGAEAEDAAHTEEADAASDRWCRVEGESNALSDFIHNWDDGLAYQSKTSQRQKWMWKLSTRGFPKSWDPSPGLFYWRRVLLAMKLKPGYKSSYPSVVGAVVNRNMDKNPCCHCQTC